MDDDEKMSRATDCRLAVLRALNDRASGAHRAEAILSIFLRNYDFTSGEVAAALELLKGEGMVRDAQPELCTEIVWSITLAGQQALARNGRRLTGIGLVAWVLTMLSLMTSCTVNPFVVTTPKGAQWTSLGGSCLTKAKTESGSITRPDGTVLRYSRADKDETRVPIQAAQVGLAKTGISAGRDIVGRVVR